MKIRLYATIYFILCYAIVGWVMFSSCNPQKRAANNFYRAVQLDKQTVYNECGKIAPPIIMTKDSFIYKQGETIKVQLPPKIIKVNCDSLIADKKEKEPDNSNNEFDIPCPPCDSTYRLDSFLRSSHNTEVNRATEYAQAETIKEQGEKIATLTQGRNIWRAIALGAILLIVLWVVIKMFRK